MITASELAGFVAAHAIWCVSDAESLIPMLAFTTENEQRKLERLAGMDAQTAVEHGRQRLESDPFQAFDGVLAYDGRIETDDGKRDAIVLELRSYCFPWANATLAVPYTPRGSGRFRVHKLTVLQWERCEDFDMDTAVHAFFRGVAAHDPGSKVWKAARDEGE